MLLATTSCNHVMCATEELGDNPWRRDRELRVPQYNLNSNGTGHDNGESKEANDIRSISRDIGCRVKWQDQNKYGEFGCYKTGAACVIIDSKPATKKTTEGSHIGNAGKSLGAIASLVKSNNSKNIRKDARPDGKRVAKRLEGNKSMAAVQPYLCFLPISSQRVS